jgi:GSCFA family
MMQLFRIPLTETPRLAPIEYSDTFFLIGSCFTDQMSARLTNAGFGTAVSPFGTVFNPVSIKDGILRMVESRVIEESELNKTNELWHTWMHHGAYSGTNQTDTLVGMNQAFAAAATRLSTCDQLVLTYGSAYAYSLKDQTGGKIVANCHKAPSHLFDKLLLSKDACQEAILDTIDAVKTINPNIQVLLTVSPVKHLRDGMIDNLRGKSTLLLACHEAAELRSRVHYLPAYELLTEDLRDYRFYANDLCHPNEAAVEYIWEWFQNNCFTPEAQDAIRVAQNLRKAINHRPLHPDTDSHRRFVVQTQRSLEEFRAKWPFASI